MEATVAERGQITLPKAVRDALGLTKGTKLTVELEGGRIVLRKDVDDALSRLGFIDTFGESAPAPALFKHFGFTPENVADTVQKVLGKR